MGVGVELGVVLLFFEEIFDIKGVERGRKW